MNSNKNKYEYPFQNPSLPMEERINNLLDLLTREEKIQLLDSGNHTISRLGFSVAGQVEGYHGAALGGPGKWGGDVPMATTQFCQAIGLAETWDPILIKEAAEAEAIEFRYAYHKLGRGGLVVRAPNADLGRDPRWGRTEECFGEDPYFNSVMTVAFVKGLQGDDPKYIRTASLLKHFLANSNEDTRTSSSSDFDDRLFREYYSYPFMKGFTVGGADNYMTAYNKYNGIPCIINPFIRDITMKEWGVDGIICTDGGALGLLVTDHHYYDNNRDASAACIKAGISQFLDPLYTDGVNEALDAGLISMEDIDEVLRRNLRIMIRLGLLDPPEMVPYTKIGQTAPWESEAHKALVKKATQKSIVLLKNSNDLLPLDKSSLKSVAVIGHKADIVHVDWYGGDLPYSITPLQGIKDKLGNNVTVNYAFDNTNNAAVEAASKSDVAIVIIGNDPVSGNLGWAITQMDSEGREAADRKSINLEKADEDILQEVLKANKNTILVLVSSFPYAVNRAQETIPSILHMTQNSQEMGSALADVIFGDYNPAGRLVQTWPKSLDQVPDIMDYNIRNGRTYMYFKGDPLYPFGYGLSYTKFRYSDLIPSSTEIGPNDTLTVTVDVENIGYRDGEEVVQLYVEYVNSSVERPIKELKAFNRVMIEAGKKTSVGLSFDARDTAYWNAEKAAWVVEDVELIIKVGGSSSDKDLYQCCKVKIKHNN
ncbi:glycoside hydrolase family 3 C-terminal domain-containing protein [Clostridium thermarum]|uniref:glycoside hydrolase family 3 C-terminal domain-containing protein n=1 Tax=Clostridium thermarum TaxID=1716543 RepID=UPI0011213875|nr:glycoside hydrolase family 3 C-terminal domain-containing protein [Clostridium thermarum]